MKHITLTQLNQSGNNSISIDSSPKSIDEEIKLYRSKNYQIKNPVDIDAYDENFKQHSNKITKSKKLHNFDFTDTDLDDFYVPLIITHDLKSLRDSRTKYSSNLTEAQAVKNNIIEFKNNLGTSDIEYLKFKASQLKNKNQKSQKSGAAQILSERYINEEFLIEDYFKELDTNIINIQAGAGYGKTTILKKILSNQAKKGTKKAIFIDLKNIESNFKEAVISSISDIIPGLDTIQTFEVLDSEKLILILDAFDEINQANIDIHKVIEDITWLAGKFPIFTLISSRPNSDLLKKSGIRILGIKDVDDDQILRIFVKLKKQDDFNISLIQEFLKNPAREAIRTPLLANLFIKTFPKLTSFPENSRDFYKKIFDLLYSGHDSFKEGKKIHRKLHDILSMERSKEYFSLLSIITLASNTDNQTSNNYASIIKEAIEFFSIPQQDAVENFSRNFIDSLIECTSLLIDTGGAGEDTTYTFLHKSIQEYYSAEFFRTNIYDNCSEGFDNELLGAIAKSIENDSNQHIDFLKNLFYSNKKIYLSTIVGPNLEVLKSKSESKDLNRYLIKKLLQNIYIETISETILKETNFSAQKAVKNTYKTTLYIEIKNTKIELDSMLCALSNILSNDERSNFDKAIDGIVDEISQLIAHENQKIIDFRSIKKIHPAFLVRYYTYNELEKMNIHQNRNITKKTEELFQIIQNSYNESAKKITMQKKNFLDKIKK